MSDTTILDSSFQLAGLDESAEASVGASTDNSITVYSSVKVAGWNDSVEGSNDPSLENLVNALTSGIMERLEDTELLAGPAFERRHPFISRIRFVNPDETGVAGPATPTNANVSALKPLVHSAVRQTAKTAIKDFEKVAKGDVKPQTAVIAYAQNATNKLVTVKFSSEGILRKITMRQASGQSVLISDVKVNGNQIGTDANNFSEVTLDGVAATNGALLSIGNSLGANSAEITMSQRVSASTILTFRLADNSATAGSLQLTALIYGE